MPHRKVEQFQDRLARLFPQPYDPEAKVKSLARNVTFQVTDDCNLRCTYCYQIHKGHHSMPFDVAKRFIDMLLAAKDDNDNEYVNSENSPGLIIEFIGGEPFLEIDLMDQITDYFISEMLRLQHPWATRYMISICSNGLLYFDERVQRYMQKHRNHLSFSITIDGNKELHDACRLRPNGEGSYDIAMAAVKDWMSKGYYMGSKITVAPGNVMYVFDAVKDIIENDYDDININCVYEEGWTAEHALILYEQLKKLADYMLENNLVETHRVAMFEENFFKPKDPSDDQNWCWGKGTPILTTSGYKPIEEIQIGEKVYTEDGSIHPVINTTSYFADNCVKIKASGINPMICTENHKLFAKPFRYLGNKGKKHYNDYGKYEVSALKNHDMIRMSTLPIGEVDVDKDLAYLVGRYIGDGWDSESNGYAICCGFDEEQELIDCFNKAKVSWYSCDNKTVKQFYCARRDKDVHNDIFSHLASQCGHLAHNKQIPAECFAWNLDSLQALIDGYLSADGYKAKDRVKINTVSKNLAEDLMLILRTLGFNPTCHVNHRAGKSMVEGREVNIKDRYEIYYYYDNTRSRFIKREDDKIWTTNFKTEKVENQMVYNLTVDTNHSYIAGGLVSSNCGGNGAMIAVDWKGDIYPCLRYMESSLGTEVPPLIIGNVYDGIMTKQCEQDCVHCLRSITRRSQSTNECFYCPIAEGCSWCSAFNYQTFGTANKRATYICIMHKARALANVYFWNKWYRQQGLEKRFENHCPDEWALEIISEEELNMLKQLSSQD